MSALTAASLMMLLWGLGVPNKATASTQSNLSEVFRPQTVAPNAEPGEVPQSWKEAQVRVVLDASVEQLSPTATDLIEASFQTWNDTGAALPVVTFERGTGALPSVKPDGKNTILVAPIEYAGHENDLAITIAFSHPKTGKISEADIVFNQKYLFKTVSQVEAERSCRAMQPSALPADQESCTGSLTSDACAESYDVQSVLTHEVGHFWGLGENYDDTRATMFSCTSACEVHKRDLNTVDVDEITALYDSSTLEAAVAAGSCSVAHGKGHSAALGQSTWLLGAILTATAAARRRRAARPHR